MDGPHILSYTLVDTCGFNSCIGWGWDFSYIENFVPILTHRRYTRYMSISIINNCHFKDIANIYQQQHTLCWNVFSIAITWQIFINDDIMLLFRNIFLSWRQLTYDWSWINMFGYQFACKFMTPYATDNWTTCGKSVYISEDHLDSWATKMTLKLWNGMSFFDFAHIVHHKTQSSLRFVVVRRWLYRHYSRVAS